MRFLLKIAFLASLGLVVTSCSDLDSSNGDPGVEALEFGAGGSCVDLVFPVAITLPDGTEIEVESAADIKTAKQDYKEVNPDEKAKISFVFPIEVINTDGAITTLDSKEALKEVKQACKDSQGKTKCIELVFPVSYTLADGTVISGESKEELRTVLKEWKEANPDADVKPQLVFPIQIINSEGETEDVENAEVLSAIKEDCKEQKGGRNSSGRG